MLKNNKFSIFLIIKIFSEKIIFMFYCCYSSQRGILVLNNIIEILLSLYVIIIIP
jgi:hypothetical protein